MGWFDEQIREREKKDDKAFLETFYQISDSVTGKNISKTLQNDHEKALGAIGEIIRCYDCKMIETSGAFSNINDELEYICRPNGIMRRSVKLEPGWYRNAFGAYLVIDEETGEIAALIPDKGTGKYRYFDNSQGKHVRVTRKNADRFLGDAICFYKPLPLRKLTGKDLLTYGLSMWSARDMALPAILVALATLLGLFAPRLNHFLFEEVVETRNMNFLLSTAVFLLCISVSRMLIDTVHTLITAKNETKTSISMEAAIMMRLLSLPARFFKQYSSGDIMQRVSYANDLCGAMVELFFTTGITSLLSLLYITQMVRYAKALLVPAIIMIALTVVFSLLLTLVNMRENKAYMEAAAKENGVAYSLITGVQKIKLAGAEKRAFARWGNYYAKTSNCSFNPPLIVKLSGVVPLLISLFGTLVIYYGAVKSSVSVADYYAFETAYAMVMGAFMMLSGMVDSIAGVKPTLDMIRPILDEEPEVSEGKQLVTRLSGNIELNNVSFRYSESMPLVLDNLSLKIRAGQYVAIVGKTGCGKSTLMRILLGFEKPLKGAVYYDGRDMANIDLKSLRRNIGTVMQDGKLFQGDIYSNITISAPWLTLDDAWAAAEMAGMAEDIEAMPMGMQTLISEGAGGISGGQRQRLMIARAIAAKPNILIFDEATSALDNITQKIVSESLDSLKCTRIVIAHRLSTIRHCDRIIFLDGGKIVEDGTYEQLIEKNGLFAELVNRQRLDEND